MTEPVPCDSKCQTKNRIIKHVNVNVIVMVITKQIIAGILPHVFVRMVSI